MIVLISGASHTGKTLLAQRLLEKYKYPYLSIDHLKMGLIRSGQTSLGPEDDRELEAYIWPIVREIIKTAVENRQDLIIEGGYIPFDWQKDFTGEYLKEIRFYCLVMTENYIRRCFDDIKGHARAIENRPDDSWCTMELLLKENSRNLRLCKDFGFEPLLIDEGYHLDIELHPTRRGE